LDKDLVYQESLGIALALINISAHVAGIFSSALLGLALHAIGFKMPFLITMLFPLTGTMLLAELVEKKSLIRKPLFKNLREIISNQGFGQANKLGVYLCHKPCPSG
jgi:hypothetical protein